MMAHHRAHKLKILAMQVNHCKRATFKLAELIYKILGEGLWSKKGLLTKELKERRGTCCDPFA